MEFRRLLLTASVASACTAGVAQADPITLNLSTHSSDATDPALLLASFTFTVTGNTLTIDVTNGTSGANSFDISAIYFNFSSNVTALSFDSLSSVSGNEVFTDWALSTPGANNPIGLFGSFDASVIDGQGAMGNAVAPGDTYTFTFSFLGGGVTEADFVDETTDLGAFIAAKFVSGPDDPEDPGNEDSAFGALIPLPPALPMGIAGLIGVAFLRRRTRGKQPRQVA